MLLLQKLWSRLAGAARRPTFKGIVYYRDGRWFAVLLDHFLMTYADTEEELKRRVHAMLETHIVACLENGIQPFAKLPPAPQKYWEMYNAADEQRVASPAPPPGLFAERYPNLALRAQTAS